MTVRVAACGFYELFFNGERITRGLLSPYISNPDHYVYYDEYTVTPRAGKNAVGDPCPRVSLVLELCTGVSRRSLGSDLRGVGAEGGGYSSDLGASRGSFRFPVSRGVRL